MLGIGRAPPSAGSMRKTLGGASEPEAAATGDAVRPSARHQASSLPHGNPQIRSGSQASSPLANRRDAPYGSVQTRTSTPANPRRLK